MSRRVRGHADGNFFFRTVLEGGSRRWDAADLEDVRHSMSWMLLHLRDAQHQLYTTKSVEPRLNSRSSFKKPYRHGISPKPHEDASYDHGIY